MVLTSNREPPLVKVVLEVVSIVVLVFITTYLYLMTGLSGDFFVLGYSLLLIGVVSSIVFLVYGKKKFEVDIDHLFISFMAFVVLCTGVVFRIPQGLDDPVLLSILGFAVFVVAMILYAGEYDILKILVLNVLLLSGAGTLLSPWIHEGVLFLLLGVAILVSIPYLSIPYESTISVVITCLAVGVLVRAFLDSGGMLVPHGTWESISIQFVVRSSHVTVFGLETPAITLSGSTFSARIHLTELVIGAIIYVLGRQKLVQFSNKTDS